MISHRFGPAVCVLVAFALVPPFIHSYAGAASDGLHARSIPEELAGFSSSAARKDSRWGKEAFDSDDWIARTYRREGSEVSLSVVRSYDLKRLYHHPELAVAYGTSFVAHETLRLPAHAEIPLHVLRSGEGWHTVAVYVLHYDGRYVEHPIAFQLRTAGELLFSRRKPMTLFFAHQIAPDGADVASLPATRLLLESIGRFTAPPSR
jgi:hypothetical protein